MTGYTVRCPGWRADNLTTWLAAVGATVMIDRMSLTWTDGLSPSAILHHPDSDPLEVLKERWHTPARFCSLPWPRPAIGGSVILPTDFVAAAKKARSCSAQDQWALTAIYTDTLFTKASLSKEQLERIEQAHKDGKISQSDIDIIKKLKRQCKFSRWTAMPRGINPHLGVLLCLCYAADDHSTEAISASALGRTSARITIDKFKKFEKRYTDTINKVKNKGDRVPTFGLGNDPDRLNPGRAGAGLGRIDPTAEALAFYGLGALGPVTARSRYAMVTCEHFNPKKRRSDSSCPDTSFLCWPAWAKEPLDRYSIAALLAAWHDMTDATTRSPIRRGANPQAWGIIAAWHSIKIGTGQGGNTDIGYLARPYWPTA